MRISDCSSDVFSSDLPRQFQVAVVENSDERHLATASWVFPLYLLLFSLFVIPIAIAGVTRLPEGMNPDLYVLTMPMAYNQIGRASCRDRVCQDVEISVGAESLKKKNKKTDGS